MSAPSTARLPHGRRPSYGESCIRPWNFRSFAPVVDPSLTDRPPFQYNTFHFYAVFRGKKLCQMIGWCPTLRISCWLKHAVTVCSLVCCFEFIFSATHKYNTLCHEAITVQVTIF